MLKRIATILLASVMSVGTLTACGEQTSTESSSAGGTESAVSTADGGSSGGTETKEVVYPIPEGGKLTIARSISGPVSSQYETMADTPFNEELEKRVGIEIEYQHPADSNAFNLLFASGDLPDIIMQYDFIKSYPGGPEKAIADGIIAPITDIIDANAPDFRNLLEENPDWKKACVTPSGEYFGFPFIRGDVILRISSGIILRENFLDELGMEVPETIDEFYNALKGMKEELNVPIPLSVTNDDVMWFLKAGLITSPYGLPCVEFYQQDGKVHYGYMESGAKESVAFLNKLYTEGLLDQNFMTQDANTKNANIMNGTCGAGYGALSGGIGNYIQTVEGEDPTYSVVGMPSLVANKGDKAMMARYEFPVTNGFTVVTPACENKEMAVQFLNYAYSEEGHLLYNFGIEGISYEMVDGEPTFTDLMKHNPDGLTFQYALAQYCRSWDGDPFLQDGRYLMQYVWRPQQQAALEAWTDNDAATYTMPPVTISQENSNEYSTMMGDINTYVSEMITKFITGAVPMDNWETEFIPALEGMNISRAIEIQQAALDEFNAR
ncbi:MAG: extracellular solute-binding protein [Candidatus Merdivicinus sp.]|jgi:putative aldouronate transport system substrate-binding protein